MIINSYCCWYCFKSFYNLWFISLF